MTRSWPPPRPGRAGPARRTGRRPAHRAGKPPRRTSNANSRVLREHGHPGRPLTGRPALSMGEALGRPRPHPAGPGRRTRTAGARPPAAPGTCWAPRQAGPAAAPGWAATRTWRRLVPGSPRDAQRLAGGARAGQLRFSDPARARRAWRRSGPRVCEITGDLAAALMPLLRRGSRGWRAARRLRHAAAEAVAHAHGWLPRGQRLPPGSYPRRAAAPAHRARRTGDPAARRGATPLGARDALTGPLPGSRESPAAPPARPPPGPPRPGRHAGPRPPDAHSRARFVPLPAPGARPVTSRRAGRRPLARPCPPAPPACLRWPCPGCAGAYRCRWPRPGGRAARAGRRSACSRPCAGAAGNSRPAPAAAGPGQGPAFWARLCRGGGRGELAGHLPVRHLGPLRHAEDLTGHVGRRGGGEQPGGGTHRIQLPHRPLACPGPPATGPGPRRRPRRPAGAPRRQRGSQGLAAALLEDLGRVSALGQRRGAGGRAEGGEDLVSRGARPGGRARRDPGRPAAAAGPGRRRRPAAAPGRR